MEPEIWSELDSIIELIASAQIPRVAASQSDRPGSLNQLEGNHLTHGNSGTDHFLVHQRIWHSRVPIGILPPVVNSGSHQPRVSTSDFLQCQGPGTHLPQPSIRVKKRQKKT